jgi:hypothetical protein
MEVSDVSPVYRHCDLARFEWNVCWRNHRLDVEAALTPEASASFRRVHQPPVKQQFAGFVIANRIQERVIQGQSYAVNCGLAVDDLQARRARMACSRPTTALWITGDYKQLQMRMARHESF